MDKASGVYLTITDNSIVPSTGGSSLGLIIPMNLVKGKIGLNLVDGSNFKDVLGYDIDYNSNYYGLSLILSWVTQAYVWRINQGATVANAYWLGSGSKNSLTGADSQLSVETLDGVKLAVGHKDPGDWGPKAFRFQPTIQSGVYSVELNEDNKYILSQEGVSKVAEDIIYNINGSDVPFFGGFVVYDASGSSVIGVLKETTSGHYKVYKVVAGAVSATATDNGFEYTEVPSSATFDPSKTYYTESTGTYTEVTGITKFADGVTYYTREKKYSLTGEIGTAEIDGDNKLSMTLDSPFNSASYWTSQYVSSAYTEWTLEYADYVDNVATNKVSTQFSINPESDIYLPNVDFGDLFVFNNGGLVSTNAELFTWQTLDNGSNGSDVDTLDPTQLDIDVLNEATDVNVLLFNGLNESASIVNAIATACASKKIHAFVDVPLLNYRDAEAWKQKIPSSEYIAVAGRADKVDIGSGYIYVYPSVKYAYIYSQMIQNQGNLYYPPAGYTTGLIPVTELEKLDYDKYGDELKTNRINYMVVTSLGAAMWEQRTTYALNSDLSYISSVFILDDIAMQIKTFERNFNFRWISAANMSLQQMGLDSILTGFKEGGYIYSYDIQMPTDNSSREYTIKISVRLAKDAEVINIDIALNP